MSATYTTDQPKLGVELARFSIFCFDIVRDTMLAPLRLGIYLWQMQGKPSIIEYAAGVALALFGFSFFYGLAQLRYGSYDIFYGTLVAWAIVGVWYLIYHTINHYALRGEHGEEYEEE